MKQRIIVGLLAMFVLVPVVEVFSASMDPQWGPPLTPQQQQEVGLPQPAWITELGFAPNDVNVGLTFLLWVINRTTANLPVTIAAVPNGQTAVTRAFTLGPAQIAPFAPDVIGCVVGQVCRLVVSTPGTVPAFETVLQLLNTAGAPVGFITPFFFGFTQ